MRCSVRPPTVRCCGRSSRCWPTTCSALEDEVALHPEASEDYDAAANRFKAASAALDYADEPIDLERVRA